MDDDILFRSVTARTTPREEQWLAAWHADSPDNGRQLDELVEVLLLTAEVDDEITFGRAPTGDEILSRGMTAKRAGARWFDGWRTPLLVAAALAAVVLSYPFARQIWAPEAAPAVSGFGADEFTTEADPATVGLRDGTVVRLAPQTRLRLHERNDGREASLSGRGYFAVTHDPAAPFTIRSDAGTVTVLGTRFDLSADGDNLRLIVVEGRVLLTVPGSTVEVGAGQLAQVLDGNLVPPVDVPDPESLIDWVGDFIVFQDTPLRTVAGEIERRHGVRLVFTDPAIGERTVTALFAGRSFDEIAEVICVVTRVQCTKEGDVLRMAP